MIDATATFWILKPTALTHLNQVTNARFGFGLLPDNALNAEGLTPVPASTSLILLGSGLLGCWVFVRKKFKK